MGMGFDSVWWCTVLMAKGRRPGRAAAAAVVAEYIREGSADESPVADDFPVRWIKLARFPGLLQGSNGGSRMAT